MVESKRMGVFERSVSIAPQYRSYMRTGMLIRQWNMRSSSQRNTRFLECQNRNRTVVESEIQRLLELVGTSMISYTHLNILFSLVICSINDRINDLWSFVRENLIYDPSPLVFAFRMLAEISHISHLIKRVLASKGKDRFTFAYHQSMSRSCVTSIDRIAGFIRFYTNQCIEFEFYGGFKTSNHCQKVDLLKCWKSNFSSSVQHFLASFRDILLSFHSLSISYTPEVVVQKVFHQISETLLHTHIRLILYNPFVWNDFFVPQLFDSFVELQDCLVTTRSNFHLVTIFTDKLEPTCIFRRLEIFLGMLTRLYERAPEPSIIKFLQFENSGQIVPTNDPGFSEIDNYGNNVSSSSAMNSVMYDNAIEQCLTNEQVLDWENCIKMSKKRQSSMTILVRKLKGKKTSRSLSSPETRIATRFSFDYDNL